MNREIKLRVWDGKNDKMILPSNSTYGGWMSNYFNGLKDKDWTYQQFTGLKDKNGQEIYEGDVVKIRGYDDWDDTVGFDVIYQVKWCNKHVGWRGFTQGMIAKNYAGSGLPEPIEIIGNVFENPELLK